MNPSQIYVAIGIVALAVIAAIIFLVKGQKPENKLTTLAALSFGFIVAGIVFGENRLIGYSLMGIGVVFALIDVAKKLKK